MGNRETLQGRTVWIFRKCQHLFNKWTIFVFFPEKVAPSLIIIGEIVEFSFCYILRSHRKSPPVCVDNMNTMACQGHWCIWERGSSRALAGLQEGCLWVEHREDAFPKARACLDFLASCSLSWDTSGQKGSPGLHSSYIHLKVFLWCRWEGKLWEGVPDSCFILLSHNGCYHYWLLNLTTVDRDFCVSNVGGSGNR